MKKILVVKEDETNRYMIRFILEKRGHEVIEARNGSTGAELAIQERPDLVLMDTQLPVLNGLEATKRIRASEIDDEIPIVALTLYDMPSSVEELLESGFTGCIEKPINIETFSLEVENFLKMHKTDDFNPNVA